jgi:fumarate reductase flavoprotein subunit
MKQLEADVVVIAAGGAGLAAATAAAEAGAKVIVFEKASTPGGTTNQAEGLFAVESRLQKVMQYPLTKEQAFKTLMDYNHWRADARLAKAIIDRSASTIDWLESLGIHFSEVACHNPGYAYTWHIIKPYSEEYEVTNQVGSAATLIKIFMDRVKELGGRVLLQTPVKKILKEGNRVAGVLAEDRDGEEIQAKAKAVVVAAGGFGDNPEWIKKYTGYEYGKDMFNVRVPGVVGEGIRMAWEAGAAQGDMVMHHWGSGPSLAQLHAVCFSFHQPNLAFNLLGQRFMNEEILALNMVYLSNAIKAQKGHCGFVVFDEGTKRYYEEVGLDFTGYGRPSTKASNFDVELSKALEGTPDPTFDVFVADSLEEVASRTGVKRDAFMKTVDEYNQACDTGRDTLFDKNARYLRPVREPRFYVKRLVLSAFGSLGGIKVNEKLEAIDKEYEPVPGLYAAGADANSLHVPDYAFVLPGSTMGFTVNSGRIAGENAAAYALAK